MADEKKVVTPAASATVPQTTTPSISAAEFADLKAAVSALAAARKNELNVKKTETVTTLMGQVNPQFSSLAYQELKAAADPNAKFAELSKIAGFKKPGVEISKAVNQQTPATPTATVAEPADIPILDDDFLPTDQAPVVDKAARLREIWKDMDSGQHISFRAVARQMRKPYKHKITPPSFSADGKTVTFNGNSYAMPEKSV